MDGIFVDGHTPRQVGNFPGCTYCYPEVASVGKTEEALKEEGVDTRSASSRSRLLEKLRLLVRPKDL